MRSRLLLILLPALLLTLACSKEKNVNNPEQTPPVIEPASITLEASHPQVLPGADATNITATLYDEAGEPVNGGYHIRLAITDAPSMEGEAAPSFYYPSTPDSALFELDVEINSQGQASAVLYSGTAAGPVTIKATLVENTSIFVEEELVLITVGNLASIDLAAEPPEISVGYDSTTVSATVLDMYGNLVGAGFAIRFGLIGGMPDRASFVYPPSEDSVLTSYEAITGENGQASVMLYSGTRSGQALIRAIALLDSTIAAEQLPVRIHAGPIAWINIYPSMEGTYSEGDSIYVNLFGAVWDQYINPANDTTAIIDLEVVPDTSAHVLSPVSPDSIGLFHSVISYTPAHLDDEMLIIARAGQVEGFLPFVPMIYQPQLAITAIPDTLYVTVDDTIAYSEITAELQDGFGFLVEGFLIDFLVQNCGIIDGPQTDTTDADGLARARFMIKNRWLPGDPPMCQAKVISRLRGYSDCEAETEIYCFGE